MTLKNKIKYFIKDFDFLRAYNSPFKPLKLKFYCGKIALGTPYFFPRKWVKATPERAHQATLDYIKSTEEFNKRNPEYTRSIRPYDEIFASKMNYSYAVPKKIGFDFVKLGWKTKWSDTDFRFEWAPIWSFVFFKWQIAIIFKAPEQNHYWECWLYYTHATDKTKSIRERITHAREGFPCIWTSSSNGVETTTCYWDIILKSKYSNDIKQYNRDQKLKQIGIK
jgi:hypothetical protein